jgi:hypothetical protein
MNSNLPSSGLKIDATNDLLAQVPGLGFKIPGVSENKQPGMAAHKGMDPATLQIEQTNDLVSRVLGKEFVTEAPKKPLQENVFSGMQPAVPAPVVEEDMDMVSRAKSALDHLSQAKAACDGVDGLEDYCEEIEDMVMDLQEMVSSVDAPQE